MQYWLIKSEPDCYSIFDLKRDKKTSWAGVRNYQARNFLKEMAVGDLLIFYHSGGNPPTAAGIAKVQKAAYQDDSALNKKDDHFDPRHTLTKPLWYTVDVSFVEAFTHPVTLGEIKIDPKLEGMKVREQGSRLSVQPVSKEHFEIIRSLGNGR